MSKPRPIPYTLTETERPVPYRLAEDQEQCTRPAKIWHRTDRTENGYAHTLCGKSIRIARATYIPPSPEATAVRKTNPCPACETMRRLNTELEHPEAHR